MSTTISPQRRKEIIDALRRGTVPRSSLDAFAVGLERFETTIDAELQAVKSGGSGFKGVPHHDGDGTTFFTIQPLARPPASEGGPRDGGGHPFRGTGSIALGLVAAVSWFAGRVFDVES